MTASLERPQPGVTASSPLLAGCHLPQAWRGQALWVILDTETRDGQAFLDTWQAWRADPERPALLHVVALAAEPPDLGTTAAPLNPHPERSALAQQLARQAWGLRAGWHRLKFEQGQVVLTLCIGEPQATLKELQFEADSVFLGTGPGTDEAAPWLKGLSRLCRRGTRLAGAAAASPALAEALAALGFVPQPGPGLAATFAPAWEPRRAAPLAPSEPLTTRRRCLVIGAGLAGCATAAELARRGWQVQLLEAAAEPATGASGLPAGLFCPHHSRDDTRISRLTRTGLRLTREAAERLLRLGEDWAPSGVLEHRVHGKPGPIGADPAGTGWSQEASAAQKQAAGLPAEAPATWHAGAGWLRPARLVRALLASAATVALRPATAVAALHLEAGRWQALGANGEPLAEAEHVVVCAGAGSRLLAGYAVPTQVIRGQLSGGPVLADDPLPPHPVNGQGSLIPHLPTAAGPWWYTGSTFDRGHQPGAPGTPTPTDGAEHRLNQDKLATLLPASATVMGDGRPLTAWAGLRCTSPDRLPLVGPIEPTQRPGLWACTALGTRGLTWGLLCAELLVAQMNGEPLPVELSQAKALLASRPAPGKSWPAHD